MGSRMRASAAAILIAAGATLVGGAGPAAAATSCVTVPAATPGFTVGVGGQQQRIPAFSGASVCAALPDGSPVAPVVSNSVVAPCATSCTTISLSVSPVDVGPVSVSFVQDGVRTTHAVDPAAIGTPASVCLVSVGTPQAPVQDCTLSLGSDQDLTATAGALIAQVTTIVNQTLAQADAIVDDAVADVTTLVNQLGPQMQAIVDNAVADVTTLVNQLGPQMLAIVDDAVADGTVLANQVAAQVTTLVNQTVAQATMLIAELRQAIEETAAQLVVTGCNTVPGGPNGEDACTNAAAWVVATAAKTRADVENAAATLVASSCNAVPDGPAGEDACTNPAAWANATASQKWTELETEINRRLAPVCDRIPPTPDGVEFCGDAGAWAQFFVDRVTDPGLLQALKDEVVCVVDPSSCWQ